jgi:lysophospholipase L1-like esterase/thioredoxin-like negative regulator of GroEL
MRDNKPKQDGENLDAPEKIKGVKLLVFRTIMVLMPLIILAFLEILLRISGVGKEIPLFIADPANEDHLQINHDIARRYFLDPDAAPGVQYPPFKKEKSEKTVRIVVQGASTVAGIPYKKGGAFPAMLEHRLKRSLPHRKAEVINTGITAVCSYTLLDLTDDIVKINPDAVIIYAGHNEYYGVLGIASSQRLGRFSGLVRFYHRMNRFRLVQVMRKAHAAFAGKKTADIITRPNSTLMERMVREKEIPFGSELYYGGVDQFRVNLTKLVGKYRKNGIPVFLCTLVSNLKDLEPFLGGGSPEPADNTSPENADYHFNLGMKLHKEGTYEMAKKHFVLARDYDLLRFRAPSEFNEIIREVADKQDAILVDVEEIFEKKSRNGIVGKELLTEHVHPNIQGYFLIADACYHSLYQSGNVEDWEHFISSGPARKSLTVTEVDSIYGLIGIRMLINSWPFKEESPDKKQTGEFFSPENHIDSLAYLLFMEQISWGEAMNNLYQHYLSTGENEKALTVAHALQIEMKYTGIPYNMEGRIYSEMGQFDQASNALRRGFEIQPMPQIAYNLGNSLISAGRPEEAVQYLEYFIEFHSDRNDVAKKLETVKALVNLEEQIRSTPDSTELYVHAAYQYLLLNQPRISDSLIRAAYSLDPQNALVKQVWRNPGNG